MWRFELGLKAQKMDSKEIQEEKSTDLVTELWGDDDWVNGEAIHETPQEEEQWMTELLWHAEFTHISESQIVMFNKQPKIKI